MLWYTVCSVEIQNSRMHEIWYMRNVVSNSEERLIFGTWRFMWCAFYNRNNRTLLTYHACEYTDTHILSLSLSCPLTLPPHCSNSPHPPFTGWQWGLRLEGCEWLHCAQRSERVREIQCQGQSRCSDGLTTWQHRPPEHKKPHVGKERFGEREGRAAT